MVSGICGMSSHSARNGLAAAWLFDRLSTFPLFPSFFPFFLSPAAASVCGWCLVGAGLVASEWTSALGSSGDFCTIVTLPQALTVFALFLSLSCRKILAKRLFFGII